MKPRPKSGWIVASNPPRDPTVARSRWRAQSDARVVAGRFGHFLDSFLLSLNLATLEILISLVFNPDHLLAPVVVVDFAYALCYQVREAVAGQPSHA